MNSLSQSYVNYTTFDLSYVNAPDSLLLANISKENVNVKLRAVGFQFMGLNIKNKKIQIDLSQVEELASKFYIPHTVFRQQIESQLPGSMTLLEMDKDTLSFNFFKTETKLVAIRPRVRLNLAQNYLLDGGMNIEPDSVVLTGPKNEIDSISTLKTLQLDLRGLTSDFSKEVGIYLSKELKNTILSSNTVTISGAVARFSEKIFEVPITVTNVPNGVYMQMFPDKVSVVCKAKISELKEFKATDFQVVADYNDIERNKPEILLLELQKTPKMVHSARLEQDQVEFILKKEE